MRKTPLKKRTPLKSRTKLKSNGIKLKKSPLKLMSKKTQAESKVWKKVKQERIEKLIEKFGYLPCELCKAPLLIFYAEGHHNSHDRRDNTEKNCRILCYTCNCYKVEDENIKDVPSLL